MLFYEVRLETEMPQMCGEDFYMYRTFKRKKAAIKAAATLARFIPYDGIKTIVKVLDSNLNIIKTFAVGED